MERKYVLVICSGLILLVVIAYMVFMEEFLVKTHDVAIVAVVPLKTEIYIGEIININVTVKNEGSFSETINVTLYYGADTIDIQKVVDIAPDKEVTLTFNWNTVNVTPANYLLWAEVSKVYGETDKKDNRYVSGILRIREKPTEPVSLYVFPPSVTSKVNQIFVVSINVSGAVDLYGWEVRLRWNSSLLNVTQVTEGSFLKTEGETFFTYKLNNTEGYIIIDCTLLGDTPGVKGNGTLLTIVFKAKAKGECVLDLYRITLISSLEKSIEHKTAGESFITITE